MEYVKFVNEYIIRLKMTNLALITNLQEKTFLTAHT